MPIIPSITRIVKISVLAGFIPANTITNLMGNVSSLKYDGIKECPALLQ